MDGKRTSHIKNQILEARFDEPTSKEATGSMNDLFFLCLNKLKSVGKKQKGGKLFASQCLVLAYDR